MVISKQFSPLGLVAALASTTLLGCADASDTDGKTSPPVTAAQRAKTLARTHIKTQGTTMRIRLKLENTSLNATLDDNSTARDFAALLPLTLTLTDYAETEKISDLPKKLSTQGAPASITPVAGDITFYAPWGNIALFYKDGHDSSGLVRLGKMDTGFEALKQPGPLRVTIERVGNEHNWFDTRSIQ